MSTVRDSRANIERFVRRNCTQGVDHMVVFLDARQPDVHALLAADPRVTVVSTLDGWWQDGERPTGLNRRQAVNASAVNCALAGHDWATWLFPLDGDEVLHLDRDRLEAMPTSARSVRLAVLEALSTDDVSMATWFKRQLAPHEGEVARERGLVGRRQDPAHFHGHTRKAGIRPGLDLRLNIHGARYDDGTKVASTPLAAARLLHFESATYDDFVRKWRALLASGPTRGVRMRDERRRLARTLDALQRLELPDDALEQRLRATYRDFVEDVHGPRLRELGLLEQVDVDTPRLASRPIDPAALGQVRATLAGLARADKSTLLTGPLEARRAELASVG